MRWISHLIATAFAASALPGPADTGATMACRPGGRITSPRRDTAPSTTPRAADLFKHMITAASQATSSSFCYRPMDTSPHHCQCNQKADEIQDQTRQHPLDLKVIYIGAYRKDLDTAGYLQAFHVMIGKGIPICR
ncbi:unnamed protein product [Polarella glacialis]|uniref:Uncharacterized protein n=1 Tax=Polarella glacialis TaxID=89957 RepID=A0A813EXY9_POLGL|nr:unnamed protein product [Polarella glacialis]CAE8631123.1 unnamed protein product [Polarella glacialis]CAE8649291.1 unnamed protein product [Polarella glacialis]CAE8712194.1 unnamed protein product [Polarella glacialis]